VKVHRSKAMRKMNARSLPEFGQMAAELNLMHEKSERSGHGLPATASHRE
jgi:hypothetical protein